MKTEENQISNEGAIGAKSWNWDAPKPQSIKLTRNLVKKIF